MNDTDYSPAALGQRFHDGSGLTSLGHIVSALIISERLIDYDHDRIIEAVEMAPEFFWDKFVDPMLDQMADELERGFMRVDAEDEDEVAHCHLHGLDSAADCDTCQVLFPQG